MQGLTTTLTLAELVTLPAKAGNMQALADYEVFITDFPNLRITPFDEAVARELALVRAATGLPTPDAVQIASARVHKADVTLSNDLLWGTRISHPSVLLLESCAE